MIVCVCVCMYVCNVISIRGYSIYTYSILYNIIGVLITYIISIDIFVFHTCIANRKKNIGTSDKLVELRKKRLVTS